MKNKKIAITILIVLSISIVGFLGFINVATAKTESGVRPLEDLALMDLTHENFVEKEARASRVEPMGSSSSGQPVVIGQDFSFVVSDDGLGIDYIEDFVVVRDGVHIILLVTKDAYESWLVDGVFHFANPIGDDSEPWMRTEDIITDEMLDYMVDEFDDNMYPIMMDIYGVPLPRPFLDESDPDREKVWTLLFNIKDDAYYDPTAESYIAGYYSLSDNIMYKKNIMHIDTFEWDHRCGSPGDPWFINDARARPYLYEGTFAHEYEHMIHADIDANEPSWVDEGLADLAGYFCGYGHSSGHLAYYLVYHDTTPLTFWGGGLEDYGASYLFQIYLYEKFGGASFTTALVLEQANGIEGIENTLAAFGYTETFDEIYDDWTIAVYLDDITPGSPYGFDTLDIGTDDTWGYSIRYVLDNMIFGGPIVATSGYAGSAKPYTAQYYRFGAKKTMPLLIYVEGEITSGPGPYGGSGFSWYSGVGAWSWQSLSQTFDLTSYTDVTLDFYTYFEIEMDWDYGYVEVYDQDTGEWYTLNDPFVEMYNDDDIPILVPMVDYIAHDQNNPNTPDGREPMAYNATGRWHAFTGASGGWIPVSMDLTPFAGHVIDLYFTTWQDGAFTLQMMYVDNIKITTDVGELYFDEVSDEIPAGWDTTPNFDGGGSWSISVAYAENNWQATFIETFKEPTKRYPKDQNWHARKLLSKQHIAMFEGTSWFNYYAPIMQMGLLEVIASPAMNTESMVLILSNRADHILPGGYIAYFAV